MSELIYLRTFCQEEEQEKKL